ncbi:hypothetical protein [Parasedimentitalea huanghaiensis]|uniref:Uncharacterized protein n=1 Tax=Parasedimentitalea huanghaiensis TaxID=2682100 RepID=A0A6L6WH97_9RHOB|nr:hypothetical protein [Zongyanglinia huanghaiensis]MVO16820.1 hypothetical protein [Zongyanglinia huanghaiensis]
MGFIRKWCQLKALDLTEAENRLIDACYAGIDCKFSNGDLPSRCSNPPGDQKIRASILRYLLLGGCEEKPLPICTINLSGAYITGTLHLDQQKLKNPLVLSKCYMSGELSAIGAFIPALEASKCVLSKMTLERAVVRNDVCLDGTVFSERVCLSGARIKGQLDCENAEFNSRKNFQGPGPNAPPYAFDGQDMHVGHGFFWKHVSVPKGAVDISLAHVGVLVDDYDSWPGEGRLRLNGFRYEGLANSPKDPRGRKKWLKEGSYWNGEFFPQPYTQLAKALRELGHDADARILLEERERLLKIEARKAMQVDTDPPSRNYVAALLNDCLCGVHYLFADKLLQGLIGYGHQPFRSLIALLVLVAAAVLPAHYAYEAGDFAPNSAVIQTSLDWKEELSSSNPAKTWSDVSQAGQDWETFSPIAYGIDVVVPIINFGQTEAWAPSTTRGRWGRILWWLKWLLSTAGWIVTALGAAAITGLIRRD